MAALLKKALEKGRNPTSSSEDSRTSQEAKKPRSGNVNLNEKDEEHEGDDEILADVNMAEGLHKTLEEINRKLEKLESIQETVSDVRASFQKLELQLQNISRFTL